MDIYRDVFRLVMQILLIVCSIIVVAVVAMQSNRNEGGSSALFGGGADNFGSKNKNKTLDGKLVLITKITATIVMILAVAIVVLDKVLPVAAS